MPNTKKKIIPEFVCEDSSNGSWFYDRGIDLFFRKEGNNINAKIYGKYLPSPEQVVKSGCTPSPATISLWRHYNA